MQVTCYLLILHNALNVVIKYSTLDNPDIKQLSILIKGCRLKVKHLLNRTDKLMHFFIKLNVGL